MGDLFKSHQINRILLKTWRGDREATLFPRTIVRKLGRSSNRNAFTNKKFSDECEKTTDCEFVPIIAVCSKGRSRRDRGVIKGTCELEVIKIGKGS